MNSVEALVTTIVKENIEDKKTVWHELCSLSPEALLQIDKEFNQKLRLGIFLGSFLTFCIMYGYKISTMMYFGIVIAK